MVRAEWPRAVLIGRAYRMPALADTVLPLQAAAMHSLGPRDRSLKRFGGRISSAAEGWPFPNVLEGVDPRLAPRHRRCLEWQTEATPLPARREMLQLPTGTVLGRRVRAVGRSGIPKGVGHRLVKAHGSSFGPRLPERVFAEPSGSDLARVLETAKRLGNLEAEFAPPG